MKHPEFFKNIDWKLLREQKLDIFYTIKDLEYDAHEANNAGEEELAKRYMRQADSLSGIISLLDTIQDYATEEMGIDEEIVFNLGKEE